MPIFNKITWWILISYMSGLAISAPVVIDSPGMHPLSGNNFTFLNFMFVI